MKWVIPSKRESVSSVYLVSSSFLIFIFTVFHSFCVSISFSFFILSAHLPSHHRHHDLRRASKIESHTERHKKRKGKAEKVSHLPLDCQLKMMAQGFHPDILCIVQLFVLVWTTIFACLTTSLASCHPTYSSYTAFSSSSSLASSSSSSPRHHFHGKSSVQLTLFCSSPFVDINIMRKRMREAELIVSWCESNTRWKKITHEFPEKRHETDEGGKEGKRDVEDARLERLPLLLLLDSCFGWFLLPKTTWTWSLLSFIPGKGSKIFLFPWCSSRTWRTRKTFSRFNSNNIVMDGSIYRKRSQCLWLTCLSSSPKKNFTDSVLLVLRFTVCSESVFCLSLYPLSLSPVVISVPIGTNRSTVTLYYPLVTFLCPPHLSFSCFSDSLLLSFLLSLLLHLFVWEPLSSSSRTKRLSSTPNKKTEETSSSSFLFFYFIITSFVHFRPSSLSLPWVSGSFSSCQFTPFKRWYI